MHNKWVNPTCIGIGALATVAQPDELLRYIQLGLSILSTLVIIVFNIYKWYKNAKKDGKITKEEIKEGIDILQDGLEDVKNTISTKEEDKK